MKAHKLSAALGSVGRAPCDKYACKNREKCASEMLACTAFRYFVQTGKSCNPKIEFPIRITQQSKPELRDFLTATRDIFDSMDDDDDDGRKRRGARVLITGVEHG